MLSHPRCNVVVKSTQVYTLEWTYSDWDFHQKSSSMYACLLCSNWTNQKKLDWWWTCGQSHSKVIYSWSNAGVTSRVTPVLFLFAHVKLVNQFNKMIQCLIKKQISFTLHLSPYLCVFAEDNFLLVLKYITPPHLMHICRRQSSISLKFYFKHLIYIVPKQVFHDCLIRRRHRNGVEGGGKRRYMHRRSPYW